MNDNTTSFTDWLNQSWGLTGNNQVTPSSVGSSGTPTATGTSGGSGFSWGNLLGSITGLGTAASSAYKNIAGGDTSNLTDAQKKALAAQKTSSATLIKFLPWIIGGVIGLIVLVVFLGRGRKG